MDDQRAFGRQLDLHLAVSGVLSGNQESFRVLVEAYYGYVYAICWSYMDLREECMDATQEAFIRTYQHLDTLRDPQKLPAFLVRTARNVCLDRLRAIRRARAMEQRYEEEMKRVGERRRRETVPAERNDAYGTLHRLIQKLPAKTREVICLHYLEEMATKDIASVLEISQAAVLKRLEYGRQLLRERLEKELKPAAALTPQERYVAVEALMAASPFGSVPWSGLATPKGTPRLRGWRAKAGLWGAAAAGTLGVVAFLAFFAFRSGEAAKTASPGADAGYTASVAPETALDRASVAQAALPEEPESDAGIQKTLDAEASSTDALAAAAVPTTTVLRVGPPPGALPAAASKVVENLIKGFEAAHPGVRVEMAFDATLDEWNASPDRLGDVMILPSASLGCRSLLAVYAEQGYIADLTDRVADPAFDRDDFYANTWDLVTYRGRTWGVPIMAPIWALAVDPRKVDPDAVQARLSDWKSLVQLAADAGLASFQEAYDGTSLLAFPAHFYWEGLFLNAGGQPELDDSFSPYGPAWQRASSEFEELVVRNPESFVDRHRLPLGRVPLRRAKPLQLVRDGVGKGSWSHLQTLDPAWLLQAFPEGLPLPPQTSLVAVVKLADPERTNLSCQLVEWLVSRDAYAAYQADLRLVPLRSSVVQASSDESLRVFATHLKATIFHQPRLNDAPYLYEYKHLVRSLVGTNTLDLQAARADGLQDPGSLTSTE